VPQSTSILLLGDAGSEVSRLRRSLARRFLLVESARDLDDARELALRCQFHVLVLVDPKQPWDELHRSLDDRDWLPPKILLIADRDFADTAIDALRDGASDVLLRPFATEDLVAAINGLGEPVESGPKSRARKTPRRLVGTTESIRKVRTLIERIAPMPATVLIEGETGTGKELVARLLHEQSGRRGPFIPVNCSAIAPDLLESELFGHTQGAFTSANRMREGLFVAAGGGTLFLDEINEMRLDMEVKLLRTLEENTIRPVGSDREIPVDCRIVASTQADLADLVAEHRFREDLYYRLNVIRIAVPPLRERRQDIPLLAAHFVENLSAEMGLSPVDLDPGQLEELLAHDWPGNVRELRNVVERTLLLGRLPAESLPKRAPRRVLPPEYPLDWTLEQVKQHHMTRVLEDSGGNKSAAARRLDISRKTLERKLGAAGPGEGGAQ
jgi:two-component system NtrC family response regulator